MGAAVLLAATRKAWVSAVASGAMSTVAAASQMDFTQLGANDVKDLVITFMLSALTAGGVTYSVPNKPKQLG